VRSEGAVVSGEERIGSLRDERDRAALAEAAGCASISGSDGVAASAGFAWARERAGAAFAAPRDFPILARDPIALRCALGAAASPICCCCQDCKMRARAGMATLL
jgi:hypothetical protein